MIHFAQDVQKRITQNFLQVKSLMSHERRTRNKIEMTVTNYGIIPMQD